MLPVYQGVLNIRDSPTICSKLLVDAMRTRGEQVYNFGVGEMSPDIPLPQSFKDGVISALQENVTHYVPPRGLPLLLQALSTDFATNFNLSYDQENICIFPGPKPAVWSVLATILDPNAKKNRVIVFSPTYESFTDVPQLLTGKPAVIVETDDNFYPYLDVLEDTLDSRDDIACIIVNSPNNPSGAVYPPTLLESMANIVKQYPTIAVISDEVYRTVYYDGAPYCSIASYLPEQTIIVGGTSKEAAGTGIRIGFAAGPTHVIKAVSSLAGCVWSCTNAPCQHGYAIFLNADKDMTERKKILAGLEAKRNLIARLFSTLPGLCLIPNKPPSGAFYFFPDIRCFIGKKTSAEKVIANDEEFCLWLLTEAKVVVLPGSKYDREGHVRLAFASSSILEIEAGIVAMSKALEQLK